MAIVQLLDEYKQTGGTLTSDSSTCTLESGLTGAADINIAGGKVVVDNIANSVGTLKFLAGTVEINGEIDVNGLATGGKSTQCDLLDCSNARVTLGTSSDLYVATTGIGTLGTGNQWIVMKYASITGNWATTSYPTGMMVSTGATQVLVSN
jgi:hypothetical protein